MSVAACACCSAVRIAVPRPPRSPRSLPIPTFPTVAVPLSAMEQTVKPRVPDKPALEGLETKWQQQWEADGAYKFDRTKSRDQIFLDRHAAADGQRLAAHRPRVLIHTHRRHRALSADARPGSVLSDGMGRQRAADRAPRAELLRRALRSVAAVRPEFPASAGAAEAANLDLASQLRRALPPADEGRRAGVRTPMALPWLVGRLVDDLRDDRQAIAARIADRDFCICTSGGWRTSSRRPRCGTWISAPLWPRPSSRIANAKGRITVCGSIAQTRAPSRSRRRVPSCCRHAWRSSRIPDDERYKSLFGKEVLTPLFRARVPVKAHELADPEKGSGIAMICTFGDITDVTWWRELSLPVRAVIQPNGTLRQVTWGETGWESQDPAAAQQAYDQIAGQSINKARAKVVELLRDSGSMIGEPRPIMHSVKFYEKGDRPLEIVTSRQWFFKTMELRSALIERGRQMQVAPRVHAGALRKLGQRLERRLVRQPPAVLRRAVPALVSDRQGRRGGLFTPARAG